MVECLHVNRSRDPGTLGLQEDIKVGVLSGHRASSLTVPDEVRGLHQALHLWLGEVELGLMTSVYFSSPLPAWWLTGPQALFSLEGLRQS